MAWPDIETFARRPRDALMWIPRAVDIARIAAVCRAVGPRVADVGAGTGLLARLLAEAGIPVRASDVTPPAVRYADVSTAGADMLAPVDVAIVSWMEAGKDYRDAVARRARCIVNVYDVEGGCGVMGGTEFTDLGFVEAATWRTPSFEDAEFALDRPGRGLRRKGYPGNRIDILVRASDIELARDVESGVRNANTADRLPWEAEMERANL